jgi:hypothetical protein
MMARMMAAGGQDSRQSYQNVSRETFLSGRSGKQGLTTPHTSCGLRRGGSRKRLAFLALKRALTSCNSIT